MSLGEVFSYASREYNRTSAFYNYAISHSLLYNKNLLIYHVETSRTRKNTLDLEFHNPLSVPRIDLFDEFFLSLNCAEKEPSAPEREDLHSFNLERDREIKYFI